MAKAELAIKEAQKAKDAKKEVEGE